MINKTLILIIILFSNIANCANQIFDSLSVGDNSFKIKEQPLDLLISVKKVQEKYNLQLCEQNKRGFYIRWSIVKDELRFSDIYKTACYGESKVSSELLLEDVLLFPQIDEVPVIATWFTGEFTIQISETEYINNTPMHDSLVYSFKNGRLISRTTIKQSK